MRNIIYILIALVIITCETKPRKSIQGTNNAPVIIDNVTTTKADSIVVDAPKLPVMELIEFDTTQIINGKIDLKRFKNAVLTTNARTMFFANRVDGLELKGLNLRAKNKLSDIFNKDSVINDPNYNTRIGIQIVNSKNVKVNENDFKYFYQIATYFSNVENGEYIGNTTSEMFRDATIDRIQPTGILVNKGSKNIKILNNKFINVFGLHGNRNSHAIYVGQGSEDILIKGNYLENVHDTSADEMPGNDISIYGVGDGGNLNKNVTITNNRLINTSSNLYHTKNGIFKDNVLINSRLSVGGTWLIEDCVFIVDNPKFKTASGMLRTTTKDTLILRNVKFINKTNNRLAIGFKNYGNNPNVIFENVEFINCLKIMER